MVSSIYKSVCNYQNTHKKNVFDKLEPHLLCILTDWQQVSCAI